MPIPSRYLIPSFAWPEAFPASAALRYHSMALASSFGKPPLPEAYRSPIDTLALSSLSATFGKFVTARLYQYAAWAGSFGTPHPASYITPRLYWEYGSSCSDDLRNQYMAWV